MWYAVGGGWKGSVLSEGQDKKHIRWLQVCEFCSTFAAVLQLCAVRRLLCGIGGIGRRARLRIWFFAE